MLKCLELIGFKSFADKTRFEFDAGMTAIVGPNGSGKSNVVDAIRWILGEQSAKSLRGKEMADVIFNGSGTRRSLGMAEVSLYLDNSKGLLPLEADEIVLTRRVYRSGESEYLINRQLARLRDIKDLFLGTGAGAYSIIEQGKVELMLQASTKDRRHIFEEAAGISKFKAKKIESLRRLDRVEQNLIRVRDIAEELDKQLRGLRAQAGKARRYKELSDRLKELRLAVGLADYATDSAQLSAVESDLTRLQSAIEENEQAVATSQARYSFLDESLTAREEAVREVTARIGEIREQISALETEAAKDRSRDAELRGEIDEGYRQILSARQRVSSLAGQLEQLTQRSLREQQEREQRAILFDERQKAFLQIAEDLETRRQSLAERQRQSAENLRKLARLENEQSGLESQLSFLWQQLERLTEKGGGLSRLLDALRRELVELSRAELAVRIQADRCRTHTSDLKDEHRQLLRQQAELRERLAALRDRRTALTSQVAALEGLQQRHEGLEAGVKQALTLRAKEDPLWQPVIGVLAECLEAPGDLADLVELALGQRAQALVVQSTDELSEELLTAARTLPGRVQFVTLADTVGERMIIFPEEITGPSLAECITCRDEFRPLVDRLLGTTFVIDDYQSLRALAKTVVDVRFMTRTGEVLEPDGAISAGPIRGATGILSRIAELRELDLQVKALAEAIVDQEELLGEVDGRVAGVEGRLGEHDLRDSILGEQCRHFATARERLMQRCSALEKEQQTTSDELLRIRGEMGQVDAQGLRVSNELSSAHDALKAISDELQGLEEAVAELEQRRQSVEGELNTAKLELAVIDERLTLSESRHGQLQADLDQRRRELTEQVGRLETARTRDDELQRRLLASAAQLAILYHQKETIAQQHGYDPDQLKALREERKELAAGLQSKRQFLDQCRQDQHSRQLRVTELRMGRQTLMSRIAEDYGVDLADLLSADYSPPEDFDAEQSRQEIHELRDKIGRLGSVNVQAIEELDELELRSQTLHFQLDDLTTAKRHLEEVISKINEESRRLFIDTFETVREHFQDVFRKLFGGGKADILLEDETDVLETGIEIIARPPGKEPRSISLLSGGEKTMTAVALLMALFRSRPSPFCILDEVDAALDEANIGRYVSLLREFLSVSQFLLITHSKTTMAAADVLHGVTQRESGISTRISVRLDDVADNGEFVDQPVEQTTTNDGAASAAS